MTDDLHKELIEILSKYEGTIVSKATILGIQHHVDSVLHKHINCGLIDAPKIKVLDMKNGTVGVIVFPPVKYKPCEAKSGADIGEESDDIEKTGTLIRRRFGDDVGTHIFENLKYMMLSKQTKKITNFRLAVIDDGFDIDTFVRGRGCCESYEDAFVIGGHVYAIGFNYGHKEVV